ncbi:hypothetical protein CBM2631_B190001 [Cupriavidus taiwanensis]|nr:hypothetical protein CBM2631_B190001 [Cupriavidus taiwanensis]
MAVGFRSRRSGLNDVPMLAWLRALSRLLSSLRQSLQRERDAEAGLLDQHAHFTGNVGRG